MPSFPRPIDEFHYELSHEIAAINQHFTLRSVPKPNQPGKLLMASWNIANLGEQKRTNDDLQLIAHILKRFDLIAIQEIKEDYSKFAKIIESIGESYDFVISDTAGNNERLGFVYNKDKVQLGRLFAEVALADKDFPSMNVYVPWSYRKQQRIDVFWNFKFRPFDRNPFVGTFQCENLDFMIANVHLYFGAFKNSKKVEERAKYARRVLEIYALSKWAEKRSKNLTSYDNDVIIVGDMNVPEMNKSDPAYSALLKSGLVPTDYKSQTGGVNEIGSNLNGDKTYDQLAVTKGNMQDRMKLYDIFDFDNAIFRSLWEQGLNMNGSTEKARTYFNSYMRAYVSDHRLLWAQIDVS